MHDNFNESLAELLYSFSSILLFPILMIIAAMAVTVLVWLGGFLREWMGRGRIRSGLRRARVSIEQIPLEVEMAWQSLTSIPHGLPNELTQASVTVPSNKRVSDKALSELELRIADRLARLHFVTRVGPMLGLLGTLIPFGPALHGLSSGNFQELSVNLITAFTTTVIGILCGCVTFGMGLVRRSWYSRDFDEIEYILESIVQVSNVQS